MIWDNREYKSFKPEVRNFFKLQRHYKLKVYLFSQTFDIDKKLRDLTDSMYLVKNNFRVFSYSKKINRIIALVEANAQGTSRIDENLKFDWFIFAPFGARRFTFIPKYVKYFNSYEAPELEHKDFEFYYGDELLAADEKQSDKVRKELEKLKRKIYKQRKRLKVNDEVTQLIGEKTIYKKMPR